jgi:hypothetical protein
MYGIWAYLSTFSRFSAFIWELGSRSVSKWKVGSGTKWKVGSGSGSGSASKWQAGSGSRSASMWCGSATLVNSQTYSSKGQHCYCSGWYLLFWKAYTPRFSNGCFWEELWWNALRIQLEVSERSCFRKKCIFASLRTKTKGVSASMRIRISQNYAHSDVQNQPVKAHGRFSFHSIQNL